MAPLVDPGPPAPSLEQEPLSITSQTPWKVGFYTFPDQGPNVSYFNCAVADWLDRRWLITRRRDMNRTGRLPVSSIVIWRLVGNNPAERFPVLFKKQWNNEEYEDPRALVFQNRMLLTYCNYTQHPVRVGQAAALLDMRFQAPNPMRPVYAKNMQNLMRQRGPEKNWTWFQHDGRLYFVYGANPHEVCGWDGRRVPVVYKTTTGIHWPYGEIRGGTSPVRVGEEYISFFHSSRMWKEPMRRYFMGAYAFRATPPFEITRWTPEPLLRGSICDPREDWNPLVVFPCGAIHDGGEWLVTLGVNDCRCASIRIPHDDLTKRMQ